jgi:hypothetical protein
MKNAKLQGMYFKFVCYKDGRQSLILPHLACCYTNFSITIYATDEYLSRNS